MLVSMKSKLSARILAGALMSIALFLLSGFEVPFLDNHAGSYFEKSIARGALAYGSCRAVNASVSVIKESNVHLEPAGVGLSLAIGQVLDPVDDMAERLSDVLVTALVSLGLQKLSYEILIVLAPIVLGVTLAFFSMLLIFKQERALRLRRVAAQFMVLIVVARFCVPLASLANGWLSASYFEPRIEEARAGIALASSELEKLKDLSLPEVDGIKGTIENSTSFLKEKAGDFKAALTSTMDQSGELVSHLLSLTFLYVGVFAVQVVLLPLLTIWLLMKLMGALFYNQRGAVGNET